MNKTHSKPMTKFNWKRLRFQVGIYHYEFNDLGEVSSVKWEWI